MTEVQLSKLISNPFRQTDLYPIDKDHVAKIKTSIEKHGFYGGIKARESKKGYYEIALGHHRIEAANKAGLKKIDIKIGKMSDDDMIKLMCAENAAQFGSHPGAIINEVDAAIGQLAIKAAKTGESLDKVITPMKLRAYFDEMRGVPQFAEALDTLKKSGRYADTIRKFAPTIAVDVTEPSLDLDIVTAFHNEQQLAAFKKAVTSEAGRRFITIDKQAKLAKHVMHELSKERATSAKSYIGVVPITNLVHEQINKAAANQKALTKADQQILERQSDSMAATQFKYLLLGLNIITSKGIKVRDILEQYKTPAEFSKHTGKIEATIMILSRIRKLIEGPKTPDFKDVKGFTLNQDEYSGEKEYGKAPLIKK